MSQTVTVTSDIGYIDNSPAKNRAMVASGRCWRPAWLIKTEREKAKRNKQK